MRGCVAGYGAADCAGGVQSRDVDRCKSDLILEEATAAAAGVCTDDHDTVEVDCLAACQAAGHIAGECDGDDDFFNEGEEIDCFGEQVLAGYCRCFDDVWIDEDGDDPYEASCLGRATGAACAAPQLDREETCSGATTVHENVAAAAYGHECFTDTCCPDYDIVEHDCQALCPNFGACVEIPITCYGEDTTAGECRCYDLDDKAKDSDDGNDPGVPGCVGEFEGDATCSDEANVHEIAPDHCLDEGVLVEMVALAGATPTDQCGDADEVYVDCAAFCVDQAQQWGSCTRTLDQIECFGTDVYADKCQCFETMWGKDTEDGPNPLTPGCVERAPNNAPACAWPFQQVELDSCAEPEDGEVATVLHEVHMAGISDQGTVEHCAPNECCPNMQTTEIDCPAFCGARGFDGGTCNEVDTLCFGEFQAVGRCECFILPAA